MQTTQEWLKIRAALTNAPAQPLPHFGPSYPFLKNQNNDLPGCSTAKLVEATSARWRKSHLHIEGQVANKDCPVALIHDIASCTPMCALTCSVHTYVQASNLHINYRTALPAAPQHSSSFATWRCTLQTMQKDNADLSARWYEHHSPGFIMCTVTQSQPTSIMGQEH